MPIATLVLHQVKDVGTVMQKEIKSECKTLTYISLALTILGLVMVAILHYRFYIPIKLCKTAGSIHLFKITGMLKAENIKLNKKYIWDMLQIDWKEVTVTFNDNKINLPESLQLNFKTKSKADV